MLMGLVQTGYDRVWLLGFRVVYARDGLDCEHKQDVNFFSFTDEREYRDLVPYLHLGCGLREVSPQGHCVVGTQSHSQTPLHSLLQMPGRKKL